MKIKTDRAPYASALGTRSMEGKGGTVRSLYGTYAYLTRVLIPLCLYIRLRGTCEPAFVLRAEVYDSLRNIRIQSLP